MKTDDLISQLSSDLKPVKPAESVFVFAIKWTVFSIVAVILVIVGLQPRFDLLQTLASFDTWAQLLGFALLLLTSLGLAGWASSPGRSGLYKYLRAVFLVLAVLAVIQTIRLLGVSQAVLAEGLSVLGSRCAIVSMIVGVLTGAFYTWKARQGATTHPLLSGLVLGLAAVGAGGVAITLHCASQNGMHIFIWHFILPLLVMTAIGSWIGQKLLRW